MRRRSALRLSDDDISRGYALACQTLVNEDVTVWVPPHEEQVQRLETGDRAEKAAPEVVLCEHPGKPWVERYHVTVEAPSMGDNTPDLERLQRELALQHGVRDVQPTLTALAKLPAVLREGEWTVTAEVEQGNSAAPDGPYRLLDVLPNEAETRVLGLAIDIGTTSVATYLGDLPRRHPYRSRLGLQQPDRLRRGRHLSHRLRSAAGTPCRNCRSGSSRPSTPSSTTCWIVSSLPPSRSLSRW